VASSTYTFQKIDKKAISEFNQLTTREVLDLWKKAMNEVYGKVGLGPSVCTKCMVYASYRKHPTDEKRQGTWYCPICGSEDTGHLFEVPEARWPEIDDNTIFYKFAAGKQ